MFLCFLGIERNEKKHLRSQILSQESVYCPYIIQNFKHYILFLLCYSDRCLYIRDFLEGHQFYYFCDARVFAARGRPLVSSMKETHITCVYYDQSILF